MEVGLLLLRLVVGLTMAAHGAQKLLGWFGGGGPAGTAAYMEQLGFRPGRRAALGSGVFELAGGLSLALGLFTAIGATMVITVLAVATFTVHIDKGFFNTNGGFELPLVLSAGALALAFIGPGPISLDAGLGIGTYGLAWGLLALGFALLFAMGAIALGRRRAEATA